MPSARASLLVLVVSLGCSSKPLEGGGPEQPAEVSPEHVQLTQVYKGPVGYSATALSWNPNRAGELWITLRKPLNDVPCTEDIQLGCSDKVGVVAQLFEGKSVIKQDGNGWHFLRLPTGIAFGDNGNLGTCGEARTDNYDNDPIDYAGPVLWSADPSIFGVKPQPGQNGTHLDMLHATPFCMGIAHHRDNAYFTFNGQIGSIDWYDFKQPHVIGGEDHADGELKRYVTGALSRVPGVPSHLAFERASNQLYIADTGNGRIARLDTTSGERDGDVMAYDPILVRWNMSNATLVDWVPRGVVAVPSGLALEGTSLWVTDNADGRLLKFDANGTLTRILQTELPAGALAGVAVSSSGALHVSDLLTGSVYEVHTDD